ncbi:response regulator [Endothiovibrio diazotrophicus]
MNDDTHILVVDDDPQLRQLLEEYLSGNGFRVSGARDGRAMWRALESTRVDLVILDLMLPGEDGLTLCRNLRARSEVPIIMLTARGEETDRIVGLEMGADDYLAKPFNPRELLARIKVILRRVRVQGETTPLSGLREVRFEGWTLEVTARHLIDPQGVVVSLSGGDYRLLELFLERPNRVLKRDLLIELLQGKEALPDDRAVDVQVSRLRRRLRDDASEPRFIKTIRGEGYLFAAKVEKG